MKIFRPTRRLLQKFRGIIKILNKFCKLKEYLNLKYAWEHQHRHVEAQANEVEWE